MRIQVVPLSPMCNGNVQYDQVQQNKDDKEYFPDSFPNLFTSVIRFCTVVVVPSGYVPLVFLTPSGWYSLSLCIGLALYINKNKPICPKMYLALSYFPRETQNMC